MAATDWAPYDGPQGGRGFRRTGPDGKVQIIYTQAQHPPGSQPRHHPHPQVHHGHQSAHGGFVQHQHTGGVQEHRSVGAHRLVSALRLAGKLINRPHLVNVGSLALLIRLLGGMSASQLRQAKGDLGRFSHSMHHGLALRERAHLSSLVNVGSHR